MQTYSGSSPVTTDDASMPLGLVSTRAPLISCGTHSLKLLFIQKAVAVVTKLCKERWEGHMYKTKLIIEQTPQSSVQIVVGGDYCYGIP